MTNKVNAFLRYISILPSVLLFSGCWTEVGNPHDDEDGDGSPANKLHIDFAITDSASFVKSDLKVDKLGLLGSNSHHKVELENSDNTISLQKGETHRLSVNFPSQSSSQYQYVSLQLPDGEVGGVELVSGEYFQAKVKSSLSSNMKIPIAINPESGKDVYVTVVFDSRSFEVGSSEAIFNPRAVSFPAKDLSSSISGLITDYVDGPNATACAWVYTSALGERTSPPPPNSPDDFNSFFQDVGDEFAENDTQSENNKKSNVKENLKSRQSIKSLELNKTFAEQDNYYDIPSPPVAGKPDQVGNQDGDNCNTAWSQVPVVNGRYKFDYLIPGEYIIYLSTPEGKLFNVSSQHSIPLKENQHLEIEGRAGLPN